MDSTAPRGTTNHHQHTITRPPSALPSLHAPVFAKPSRWALAKRAGGSYAEAGMAGILAPAMPLSISAVDSRRRLLRRTGFHGFGLASESLRGAPAFTCRTSTATQQSRSFHGTCIAGVPRVLLVVDLTCICNGASSAGGAGRGPGWREAQVGMLAARPPRVWPAHAEPTGYRPSQA